MVTGLLKRQLPRQIDGDDGGHMLRQIEDAGCRGLGVDVDEIETLGIVAAQEVADLLPFELKDPPGPEIETAVDKRQDLESPQPFGQTVHPVEPDQCRIEARIASEMLLQKAEVRLVTHPVFDKEEGSGGVYGRSGRRQLLDLRSQSTPPSKVV